MKKELYLWDYIAALLWTISTLIAALALFWGYQEIHIGLYILASGNFALLLWVGFLKKINKGGKIETKH